MLNDESQPWSREVAPAAQREGTVEQEIRHTKNHPEEIEDATAREVMSALRALVENEIATVVKKH